jgi:hypothetical protein
MAFFGEVPPSDPSVYVTVLPLSQMENMINGIFISSEFYEGNQIGQKATEHARL